MLQSRGVQRGGGGGGGGAKGAICPGPQTQGGPKMKIRY